MDVETNMKSDSFFKKKSPTDFPHLIEFLIWKPKVVNIHISGSNETQWTGDVNREIKWLVRFIRARHVGGSI